MVKIDVTAAVSLLALTSVVQCDASDFLDQAIKLMEESPLLDTHIDLPQIIRSLRMSDCPLRHEMALSLLIL